MTEGENGVRKGDVLVRADITGTGGFEAIATLRATTIAINYVKEGDVEADDFRDWLMGQYGVGDEI